MDRLPDNLKKSPNSEVWNSLLKNHFKLLSSRASSFMLSMCTCPTYSMGVCVCVRVCVFIMVHLIVFSKLLFPPSVQMEAVTRTVSCPPTVRQVRDSWRFTVSSTCSLWKLQPACLQMIPLTSKNSTPTQWSKHHVQLIWKLNSPQVFMKKPPIWKKKRKEVLCVLLMRLFFSQKECRKWKLISLAFKN